MFVSWLHNTTKQNFAGKKTKAHLMSAWEGSNNTVDLQQLRQQILAMQKAYDNVAPANIAKTILEEHEGFNPFNLLKHSFWYLAGISVLLFICFLAISVGCHVVQRQLLGLRVGLHWEHE
jgi:hypothetical protein